jgi:hypothetical protein
MPQRNHRAADDGMDGLGRIVNAAQRAVDLLSTHRHRSSPGATPEGVGLKWKQVFRDERLITLEIDVMKNGQPLGIPPNDTARWTKATGREAPHYVVENFRFHHTQHV